MNIMLALIIKYISNIFVQINIENEHQTNLNFYVCLIIGSKNGIKTQGNSN